MWAISSGSESVMKPTEAKVVPDRLDALTERLDVLERENRRLKWVAALVFVTAVVLVVEGTALVKPRKSLEARNLVIRDDAGKVRAQFGLDSLGRPEMAIFNSQGEKQIQLGAEDDNASGLMFTDHHQTRLHLAAGGDGSAGLRFFDRNQLSHTGLFLWPDGTNGLALTHDLMGIMLGVQPDGLTGIAVTDSEGNERGRLGGLPENVQCLGLTAHDGKAPFRVVSPESTAPIRIHGARQITPTDEENRQFAQPDGLQSRTGRPS